MKENEREIWIGENRHYLGEDDILYITVVGEIDEKMALKWKEIDNKLVEKFGIKGKINVLIDLNKAGKPTSKARAVLIKLSEEKEAGKTAFFRLHPVARVLASFFIGTTKNKNVRFFKTKKEALAWLNERVE